MDIAAEGAGAWDRLWTGLRQAGLDPRDDFERDPARAPYPGLDAFERQDAAVYFGREAEVAEALEALQRMRRGREPRLLAVLGASGSGKSSLMRGGVSPRLAKDTSTGWCCRHFAPATTRAAPLPVPSPKPPAVMANGKRSVIGWRPTKARRRSETWRTTLRWPAGSRGRRCSSSSTSSTSSKRGSSAGW